MKCAFCRSTKTHVVDSRVARRGEQIRRRRECDDCQERFTTFESVEHVTPNVLKANSSMEAFSQEKVLRSLRLACQKRPVPLDALADFVSQLETRVAQGPGRIVESGLIGDMILSFLRKQDAVAYVRYASVYRSFENVEQFMTELLLLQDGTRVYGTNTIDHRSPVPAKDDDDDGTPDDQDDGA